MFRSLNIRFQDRESFAQEYQRNLANGGIFIPTPDDFEPREVIDVELDLEFCERFVTLQAEVVSRVGSSGGDGGGVAVQFLMPADELRDLLGGIAGVASRASSAPAAPARDKPKRASEGERLSLALQLEAGGRIVRGRTRELGAARAVLWTEGPPLPVGELVRLVVLHPDGERDFPIGGTVAQRVERDGRITGIVVDLDSEATRSGSAALDDLRRAVREQQLASIRGPVAALGLSNLLQTFASSSERGTFSVFRDDEEGRISFEQGALRHVAIGSVGGMKALSRLLAWDDGVFYFTPTLDPQDPEQEPMPIYGAVLEAVTELDELARLDLAALPASARLARAGDDAPGDLDKTAAELLDAAGRGSAVGALLDAVSASDAESYGALLSLLEAGLLTPLE
jgi:Tfp pilus assembly protein PilZ